MKSSRGEWNRTIAGIGVVLLIAGGLRYAIEGELLKFSEGLLIAGAVLVIASIVLGFRGILGFFSRRSSQLGTNTIVLGIAVIAILCAVNFAGYKYHKQFDMTQEGLFTLSGQTKKILNGLHQDIDVVRFVRLPEQDQAEHQFDDMMAEYREQSRRIEFKNVDPVQKPEVAQEYGAKEMGDVVLRSGTRTQHVASTGGSPSESDMTSAILKLTQDTVKTVCFITGHGEKSITDTQEHGYSGMDQALKSEGYATKSINLVTGNGVPSDCEVLVAAGPTEAYFPQETAMLGTFLDNGGKVLIEEDPDTDPKLDTIYQAWNVNVGKNVVVDASGVGRLFGMGPAAPLVVDYGDSPITKDLQRGMTFFPLARTAAEATPPKANITGVELLKTSARSFTIPNLKQKEVSFDPKIDTAGPLSLGVAMSKTESGKTARLVVIGNSQFASNQYAGMQHNGDLFMNTVDWLAQDENLISIRPKTATNRAITLTEAQERTLWWFDLICLPGIIIFSGVYIWWKRR